MNYDDIIHEKQDLTYLTWSHIRNSSGTAGSFLKAYSDFDDKKLYYKLSNFDRVNGIVGHECVNEIIVSRLLSLLGIEHLSYKLIHADISIEDKIYDTYVCVSEDFKQHGESKLALDAYYEAERENGDSPLEFCIKQGWGKYISQMLLVDFLILNRDRHGANIEVLRNNKKRTVRLAPLFDHGLSLVFSCTNMQLLEKYDITADKPVQCFVGSRSTQDNLKLISSRYLEDVNSLKESDRESLFRGMDEILPREWQDKIWQMIWWRWCYYENIASH